VIVLLAHSVGSWTLTDVPADVPVTYWGDIDTHGFVTLDRLRAMHPHVESVLMDLPTLTAHRSQWVREPKPSREILGRLTAEESEVYAALTRDTLGPAVRLEQERVAFALVERVLRSRLSGSATGPARASGSDTAPPTCRTRAPRRRRARRRCRPAPRLNGGVRNLTTVQVDSGVRSTGCPTGSPVFFRSARKSS